MIGSAVGGRQSIPSNYTTVVSAMAMEAPPPPVALREDNVPDDLICSICMTVPTEPLLTPCDHLFCRTCIRQALRNQNLCPIDRQPCTHGQLKQLDGLSLRIWSGIHVKCGCHESGCIWTGSMADYSAHLESCNVYSNSNSALRRENARLKEQLEEKDEEITSLQARLNEALRNNERNEIRYRSTLDEFNATRSLEDAAVGNMRSMPRTMGAGVSMNGGMHGMTVWTEVQLDIMDAIRLSPHVDTGADISDIIHALQSARGYSEGELRNAIETLSNEGMIYSTIDEAHFQIAE